MHSTDSATIAGTSPMAARLTEVVAIAAMVARVEDSSEVCTPPKP